MSGTYDVLGVWGKETPYPVEVNPNPNWGGRNGVTGGGASQPRTPQLFITFSKIFYKIFT